MKRDEIWSMAGGPGYASKPCPAVIIQDDGFTETLSIAVCPLTSCCASTDRCWCF
jgi:mRNA interferase MazF